MVIFFEWHQTPVDQKSSSGLPMTGEDTGLGAFASPLAGYLGKVQERAASLENCPWCTLKGLTFALHAFRINLQESITLCTNPQCLFPLVSRSLEDVLAGLVHVEPMVGSKRKNPPSQEEEELNKCSPKRLRSNELDTQNVTGTNISLAELCAVNTISNGQHAEDKADIDKVNEYDTVLDCPGAETKEGRSQEDVALEKESDKASCTENSAPPTCSASDGHLQSSTEALLTAGEDEPALSPHCGALGISGAEDDSKQVKVSHSEVLKKCCIQVPDQSSSPDDDSNPSPQLSEHTATTKEKPQTPDVTTCKDITGIKSETEEFSSTSVTDTEELVSVPNQIFWWNRDNLCWLDSLLVALVKCKSLKKCKPIEEPERAFVWQLMSAYEDICAAIQAHHHTGRDGVVKVPNHVMQKATADLQHLRMSVFQLLQPKLHCKLGVRETPVFALPLLLATDSWAESLFQSTFHWEFMCGECRAASEERVVKTLPTFTNIVPDWRPLHAVHMAPCNICCKKNQKRTMTLESVPPVFMLHFVEGLPDNDVRIYDFDFKGKRYSITTVIQYKHRQKHFVTWVCQSDGTWLEYNDLKHPDCKTHQKLQVLAREMHVVFWEVKEDKEPRICSPTSTFSDSPPTQNKITLNLSARDEPAHEPMACSPDQSLAMCHNDTDIVCALSVSEDGNGIMNRTTAADMSIGSTTLLDAFEGLSHNDIITLTLVEVKPDSEMPPVNDDKLTQDLSDQSKNEMLDAKPDSSTTVKGSHGHDSPANRSLSDSESGNGSSTDPPFEPYATRGKGRGTARGKAASRQKVKKAAPPKHSAHISSPESSEPSEVTDDKPVSATGQENTSPDDSSSQNTSLPSSDTSCLSTSQKKPTPHQSARWSFLLSKNPLIPTVQNSSAEPTPVQSSTTVTQVKPPPSTHSTPNPVRRQKILGGLLQKPQLRTEENEGLPMKAAEMYGGFSAKTSDTPSLLPPSPIQPITSYDQKPLSNTTTVSAASLPTPTANWHPEMSSNKRSNSSGKVPPGLSDTELLRYKLLKKLKSKKKKLAKLNELLGHRGAGGFRPDSTDLSSPNTVTSSTYDGSTCDDILSDLLSPATTVSNLSPDSTGLLEMLAQGQDGVSQPDCEVNTVSAVSQRNICTNLFETENFMDEFISQAVAQRPTEMESEALSALELFI